jgi:hypothetical protein
VWLVLTGVVGLFRWCSKDRTTRTCKRRFVHFPGWGDCKDEDSRPRPGGCPRWSVDGVMGSGWPSRLRGVIV